jgi:methyl-accepting chemotaxis protein
MVGDFSQRVPLDGKEGVIRKLASSMNTMCENVGAVFDDLVQMLGALAQGDLTSRIAADYQGAFAHLKATPTARRSDCRRRLRKSWQQPRRSRTRPSRFQCACSGCNRHAA